LVIGVLLFNVVGFGLSAWFAAFMMRSHHMGTSELGIWLGLIFGFGGIAGVLFGGFAADRWFAEDERGQMRLVAATVASLVPLYALFLLLPVKFYALLTLVPAMVVANMFFGPTFALMQRLVADEMRATTVAVVMLLCNLIGMGVGPQAVGILSDSLKSVMGSDSLRYAMLITSFLGLWAAYHFWRVGRNVKKDLSAVECQAQADSIRPRRIGVSLSYTTSQID
jgi:MFS family permease